MSSDDSTTRALGTAVSDNLERSFATLAAHSPAGATRQFGAVTAVSAGVPTPVFNRVFVFEPPSQRELRRAIAWVTEREDPFWVTAHASLADAVDATAGEADLEQSDGTQPGMALTPLAERQPGPSVAAIDAATDPAALDDWASVAEAVFDVSATTTALLTPESVLVDDDLQPFVGRVDGTPAACGLLVRTDDVAGVYTIGVAEAYRRRGIGEAMTRAVLAAGRDLGCRVGVLQSSAMGVGLYERMGFETVVAYSHWRLAE